MSEEISLKQATILNAIAKYGTMIVQFGLTMILARLVLPEAYGVVVILTVLTNFLALFADMGLGISVVQHPEFKRKELNELFSFCIVVGMVLATLMCLLGYPISIIYKNGDYLHFCPIVSINALLTAMNTIPNSILMRDKRFDIIAIRTILCTFISGIIAVVLAYLGLGVYALLALHISSNLLVFLWNYFQNPLRWSRFQFERIKSLLGRYSLYQFLFNILNYFTRNLDNLIIGAKFNKASLGYYDKAYTLSLYPNSIFTAVITGVIHPYIRDYKNNFDALYDKMIMILKFLSLCGVLVMTICFICAKEMVLILFGSNWEPSVDCFKMLSLCMWSQFISPVAGSIFLGIERTDQTFRCGIVNFALILCAIAYGLLLYSVLSLALGIAIAYILIFLITYYVLIKKTMGKSYFSFIRVFLSDAIFAFGLIGLSTFIPDFSIGLFPTMLLKTIVLVLLFLAYLLVTRQFHQFTYFIIKVKR